MRLLANIANVILLGLVAYNLIEHGFPSADEFWLVLFLCVAPALSLLCINRRSGGIKQGWLGLYLQRKALEERLRITELERGRSVSDQDA